MKYSQNKCDHIFSSLYNTTVIYKIHSKILFITHKNEKLFSFGVSRSGEERNKDETFIHSISDIHEIG